MFRNELYQKFVEIDVFGRVYIASEGINGQISVPQNKKDAFKKSLQCSPRIKRYVNEALDNDGKSFWVLRMKVRNKVVADGIDDPSFNPSNTENI